MDGLKVSSPLGKVGPPSRVNGVLTWQSAAPASASTVPLQGGHPASAAISVAERNWARAGQGRFAPATDSPAVARILYSGEDGDAGEEVQEVELGAEEGDCDEVATGVQVQDGDQKEKPYVNPELLDAFRDKYRVLKEQEMILSHSREALDAYARDLELRENELQRTVKQRTQKQKQATTRKKAKSRPRPQPIKAGASGVAEKMRSQLLGDEKLAAMSPASQAWAHKMQASKSKIQGRALEVGAPAPTADIEGEGNAVAEETAATAVIMASTAVMTAAKAVSPPSRATESRLSTPATGHSKSARKDVSKRPSSLAPSPYAQKSRKQELKERSVKLHQENVRFKMKVEDLLSRNRALAKELADHKSRRHRHKAIVTDLRKELFKAQGLAAASEEALAEIESLGKRLKESEAERTKLTEVLREQHEVLSSSQERVKEYESMEKRWAADWEANLKEIRDLRAAVSELSSSSSRAKSKSKRRANGVSAVAAGSAAVAPTVPAPLSVDDAVAVAARAAKEFLKEQQQKLRAGFKTKTRSKK